ncbi:DNA-binding PadR family transcriptional regulator [Thermocatellispora tengchongensis]|uniref:DNA-binding PadR family transcriptional regulator n=1 Tax=Thermocatellispora tengchongensis TaxID=1073253 RepID=A0A840PEY9_9ACTN|nr:PadR family transcriptional regulator [Thermocatellispora tengchongensis]MBB5136401.1 DNA-binding PadR family transcriptional regulator [Thermocatellispora tengchongensis]
MAGRGRGNPLALAVLALLYEKPMHPYELATTMRERRKEESIKLNYGSLYAVVQALQKRGLIEELETVREGRRPERTVYGITERGRLELFDWLGELISTPVKEYTNFEAALSLLPVLPVEDALALLRERRTKLEQELTAADALREWVGKQGVPRLYYIEWEYTVRLRRAELEWVAELIEEIAEGRLEGMDVWRSFQREFQGEFQGEAQGEGRRAEDRG